MKTNTKNALFVSAVLSTGLLLAFAIYNASLDYSVMSGSVIRKSHIEETRQNSLYEMVKSLTDYQPERWTIIIRGLDRNNQVRDVEILVEESEWHRIEEGDFRVIR